MKIKLAAIAAMAAVATPTAAVAEADAAVVPNMFQRSCYFTCSGFVQSNGPYNAAFPSACITKSWSGTSSYYLPAGRRC